ncbi:hypothetical protein C6P40_001252 [Pichia californica]|uniref:F-box domain-containing protein n=1 Tax=Pichia californica TaxID=460514 RepID=A0A9P6WRD1_9ASCO|nr:hypothetical protein C6P42_004392 [[Candida] californica]KAG0690818.1 hypothetical protein C6P40_001252 [[Candida] californica]
MSQVDVEKLEFELKNITIKEINEHPTKSREDIAFELFELAIEKEDIGKLNDASNYYWKAFKLDEKVDLKYREKYFGNIKSDDSKQIIEVKKKIKNENNFKPLELNKNQLIKLLDSYSKCDIIPLDEEKPIYIERLPYEVIEKIFEILLIIDTPSWINFSLICKKYSFYGFRDLNIWKKLNELNYSRQNYKDNDEEKFKILIKNQWGFNYYQMLNERPFIKFRGVYISKVSYMKEGARSENSNSWNLPYRIISYYRYYRFYSDGTCLKIITVLEPKKVIPKLHKGYKISEDIELMNEEINRPEPENIKSPVDNFSNRNWLRIFEGKYEISLQGFVETNCDGPVEKYRFIDKFNIINSGKYHRHNKLEWVDLGFFDTVNQTYSSLNRENEKDFVFSRVKSYGY